MSIPARSAVIACALPGLPALLGLLAAGCASLPRTLTPFHRTVLVCDARDATDLERASARAWLARENTGPLRAYLVESDADLYWLTEFRHRAGKGLRLRDLPLEDVPRLDALPETPPATPLPNGNRAFLRAFPRRVPLAETLRVHADPEAIHVAWIWHDGPRPGLAPRTWARLLEWQQPATPVGLALDAATLEDLPLFADAVARPFTLEQHHGPVFAGTDAARIRETRPTLAGAAGWIASPTPSESRLFRAGQEETAHPMSDVPPVIVRHNNALEVISDLLAHHEEGQRFVWCLADANTVPPDLPAEVARLLPPAWTWVTPAELLHLAQRPEILSATVEDQDIAGFRMRLWDVVDPILPIGVGVRWTAGTEPRWMEIRYREGTGRRRVAALEPREEWFIGFLPPVLDDTVLHYQFVAADAGGPIRTSQSRHSAIPRDDRDGDGLSNERELLLGTGPREPDSDGDGILDGDDPEPLSPPSPELDRIPLSRLLRHAGGTHTVQDGAILLAGDGRLELPVRVNAPGDARGYRLQLENAGGAWRVLASLDGNTWEELLHGRRAGDERSPRERRVQELPPEFAGAPEFRLRIEPDPEGILGPPRIGAIRILLPAGSTE